MKNRFQNQINLGFTVSLSPTNAMIIASEPVFKPQDLQKYRRKIMPSTSFLVQRKCSINSSSDNNYQVQCSDHYSTFALGVVPCTKRNMSIPREEAHRTKTECLLCANHFFILRLKHRGAYKVPLPYTQMPTF